MTGILLWIIIAAALLLLFGVFLLLGIVRKNLNMVILSVALFGLSMLAGAVAAYKFVDSSYHKLK